MVFKPIQLALVVLARVPHLATRILTQVVAALSGQIIRDHVLAQASPYRAVAKADVVQPAPVVLRRVMRQNRCRASLLAATHRRAARGSERRQQRTGRCQVGSRNQKITTLHDEGLHLGATCQPPERTAPSLIVARLIAHHKHTRETSSTIRRPTSGTAMAPNDRPSFRAVRSHRLRLFSDLSCTACTTVLPAFQPASCMPPASSRWSTNPLQSVSRLQPGLRRAFRHPSTCATTSAGFRSSCHPSSRLD